MKEHPKLCPTAGALLAAILALTLVGCGNTRPCRSGTVFISLKFGALTQADLLTVDVTVNAGPKKTLTQTLTNASGGSMELTFPSGYVAGSTVTILATLSKAGTVLATRGPISTPLAPGCSSLDFDFGGVDAGAGGTTASSGGAGGTTTNSGGAGGTTTSSGGAAGGSTGSGGAAGGRAGSGGIAGSIGIGGAVGGAGGRIGSGGVGGGSIGSGGALGGSTGGGGMAAGGNGGTVGGAGGSACKPLRPTEECFNGLDDNCDGKIDCEDTACMPFAQCVALDPTSGAVGASVDPTSECPPEAPNVKTLQNGVTAAGCTGCSCAPNASTLVCSADIYGYGLLEPNCGNNSGGTMVTTLKSTDACATPWQGQGNVYGIRAPTFRGALTGTCSPVGTPTKGAPVWNSSAKFCGVPNVGGGCRVGYSCVPRAVATAGACVLMAGTQTCPATAPKASAWFTGVTDSRTCAACQCGAPTGGDCNSLLIRVDSDSTCSSAAPLGYVRSGDKLCNLALTGVPNPGIQFSGAPQPPSCAASSAVSGFLSTTGPQTLCCL